MLGKQQKILNEFELKNKIEKYQVISFDIFDTLLKRNVKKPTDVFKLIEFETKCDGFAKKRIEAEKIARSKAKGEEVTLKDIYELIPSNFQNMIKKELCAEKDVLTINPILKEIYDFCKKKSKKIFIISDMYLPRSFIEEVLVKNGITNYERLYLSCEENKTKRTGTLFKCFLEKEKLKPSEVLHVGDSYISDYQKPRKMGIDTYLISREIPNWSCIARKNNQNLKLQYLDTFINNHVFSSDEYYRFGFTAFGPFLWGYVRWLHNCFKQEGVDKVFFLARDGLIMQKAYQTCFGKKCINNDYLEVSRRSLRVPVLWMNTSFEVLLGMISPSKLISIKSIFDGVGLDIGKYHDILLKYGFDEKSIFDRKTIIDNKFLKEMYNELIPDIVSNSKKEYAMLVNYLKQNHVKGKFAIVDIGWSGGMQRFLDQTLTRLKIAHEIHGYYTGVAAYYTRNKNAVSNLSLNGYLFDFSHDKNAKDMRSGFVGLFESLFLEQAGSVKNYRNDNNGYIVAERYSYEYIKNGKPTQELKKIRTVQTAALDFIKEVSEDKYLNEFRFSSKELFENMNQCGNKPQKYDLHLFSDFKFYDEGITSKLAAPKSILHYIRCPRDLKKDFLNSRWKIGFMKKMMKISFPYNRLYEILSRYK